MQFHSTILYLVILLFLTISACDDTESFVGSDNIITEDRAISNFTGVRASENIIVNITAGTENSVIVRANDNIIDRVRTEVSGNVLQIGLRNGNYRNIDISAEIVMADLSFLRASDAAEITAGAFDNLDELRLEATDSGEIEVTGSTTELSIVSSDGAEIRAFGVSAIRCDVNVSDGADAEVNVSQEITGRVSDGGDLFYRGNPILNVSTSDGGEVINAN
ncbi:MAG: head GIN domain-containing protein [Bacteroidota bacterium]